ncbi:MAG: imidazole glycerol phosphate synthase subunit HisH [Chloroflexi bacterium]|nr:imidazole glycerol phosphate synthase subunit HisH [Chloroflexota bacterium]
MIAIVDYGAGNLRSVAKALEHVGATPAVTDCPEEVRRASAVVLPGVGAAADTMRNLAARGLVGPVREAIAAGKPFLGVCMGLQVLLDGSEEGGWQDCLGILAGRVRRLPSGLKVPHMGWNQVRQRQPHPVFAGIPDGAHFYFVHSYYVDPIDRSVVAGETTYGSTFPSVVIAGHVVATQFHPEKSGDVGLRFYANYLRWARELV